MAKKTIQVRARKDEKWEELCELLIASNLDISFFPREGEIFIGSLGEYRSVILRKDGTWKLD